MRDDAQGAQILNLVCLYCSVAAFSVLLSSLWDVVALVAGEVKYCIAKLFSGDVKFATALDY